MPEIKRLELISFEKELALLGPQPSAFQLCLKIRDVLNEGMPAAVRASKRLDFLFHEFIAYNPKFEDLLQGVSALNRFLFKDKNFKVTEGEVLGADCIFIGKVIEDRAGSPLSLSLIYREMIRKMNLGAADFVNFPGLPAVKILFNHQILILNPAEEGRVISLAELQTRLEKRFGKTTTLSGTYLETPTEHQIVSRFLLNLKNSYFERRDWAKLLAVLDILVCVGPGKLMEVKERGLLLYQLGLFTDAYEDLRFFITNSRPSQEVESLRKLMSHIQKPQVTPLH